MATSKGKSPAIELEVGNRAVRISNPIRVYFPARGETKLDLARYYVSVGDDCPGVVPSAVHDASLSRRPS